MKISDSTIAALCETKPPTALPGAKAFTAEIHELERELGLEPSRASFDMRSNAQRLSELRHLASRLAQPAPVAAPSAPSSPTVVAPKLRGLALAAASVRIHGQPSETAPLHPTLRGRARMLDTLKIEGVKP